MIKIICDGRWRVGVIPRVNPTVPTAEADSNRQSDRGSFSMTLIRMPPVKNIAKYIIAMEEVLPKGCYGIKY